MKTLDLNDIKEQLETILAIKKRPDSKDLKIFFPYDAVTGWQDLNLARIILFNKFGLKAK